MVVQNLVVMVITKIMDEGTLKSKINYQSNNYQSDR